MMLMTMRTRRIADRALSSGRSHGRIGGTTALAVVMAFLLGACGAAAEHGEAAHGSSTTDAAKHEVAADPATEVVSENGAAEHGAAEHGAAEHGAAEHGAAEHGAAENGAAKHGAAKHGAAEAVEHGAGDEEESDSAVHRATVSAVEIKDAAEAVGAGAAAPAELSATERLAAAAAEREGASVAEEFTAEVRAVRDWLTLSTILLLGALFALAWFSTQLIQWLIRLGYRLGIQRARWVDNFGMVGRLGIWAWAVMMILIRAWRIAPMITLFATGLVAAGLMVGLVKHFENLSTGFGLALRGRIKVGDQITLGTHTGMVRHIGLMQVHLRTPEGSVFLPNRLLAGEALSIGRSRNSYPLRARLTAARAWPPKALEAARCVAMLSPYRDVNSRVNVHCEPEDERALLVEIQVWSPRLLDAADKHLRTMLEENIRGMIRDDDLD